MTRRIAIRLAVTCVSVMAPLYALGWALSRPEQVQIGPPPVSLDAESVTFSSQSGSLIHGWLSRAPGSAGAVLLLPGVHANRRSMVARAAAVLAAPALDVQGAVLEAVYPSIDRAVGNRIEKALGKWGRWLAPALLLQLGPQIGITAGDLRPVDHISSLRCPILMIGGTVDRHTTLEDTQLLYGAANHPKELWLIPNAAHVDFLRFAGDEYQRRVVTFLTAAFNRAPR